MTSPEILTMLNEKTIDFESISSGGYGVPEVTPSMVAQAFAGIDNKYMYAAMIKICGDIAQAKKLIDPWLLGDVSKIAVKENWNIQKGDLTALCELAICEIHSPSMFNDDEKRGIALSINTGRIIVGLEFLKLYRRYYNVIYNIVDEYCCTAIRHLKKTWGDDSE